MTGVVLDAGALDDLLDEAFRATFLDVAAARHFQLIVPPTVVTEFLLGHPKDRVRADRVLNALEQVDATPQLARRAAWLLARAARGLELIPSVSDGMVAALGEIYGAVATHDDKDLRALASAGTGFDVYGVREMLDVMGGQRR